MLTILGTKDKLIGTLKRMLKTMIDIKRGLKGKWRRWKTEMTEIKERL
jgi:hypothetical protein